MAFRRPTWLQLFRFSRGAVRIELISCWAQCLTYEPLRDWTVTHELSTGYHMSYVSDTFFPQMPEADRIVA
jgi:hypothetical protein